MNLFAHIEQATGVVKNIVVGRAEVPAGCIEIETWMDTDTPEVTPNPRQNCASIGGTYDAVQDAFFPQEPPSPPVVDDE